MDMLTLRYYWKSKRNEMKKVKVKKSVGAHLAHTGHLLPTVAALVAPLQNKNYHTFDIQITFPPAKCLCNFFS